MDIHDAQAVIYSETEDQDGFLFRFAVGGKFQTEKWERLQQAIHVYAESLTDDDDALDRRTAGDLHYLTQVLTLASEATQAAGEVNTPLEAAAGALWEYNHKIFSVPRIVPENFEALKIQPPILNMAEAVNAPSIPSYAAHVLW